MAKVKHIQRHIRFRGILSVSLAECEQLAETELEADSAEQVLESVIEKVRPLLPEVFK